MLLTRLIVAVSCCLRMFIAYELPTADQVLETEKILIDKPDICSGNSDLVIAIKSGYGTRRRVVQRKTFLRNVKSMGVNYFFVLGNIINKTKFRRAIKEDKKYHDLVIGQFIDSYHNLTRKSIFTLRFIRNRCPDKWFLYIDDDAILNIKNILEYIEVYGKSRESRNS